MVVFTALIVLSLCGLGWYLLAGHSWNVAASNIDDTFGSMDGYTAIVYAGTEQQEAPSANEDAAAGAGAAGAAAGAAGAADTAADANPDAAKTDPAIPAEDAAATPEPASPDTGLTAKEPLEVAEVQKSYEDKNATVFALDTADIVQYREGTILKKGGHRFGVFSVDEPTSSIILEKRIAYFKRYKVDFIVVLTSDKKYVEGVSGLDIVLCTQDEGLFVMGETVDGTFYVDAPEAGKVGAILISPSNVVSAKVIQEL